MRAVGCDIALCLCTVVAFTSLVSSRKLFKICYYYSTYRYIKILIKDAKMSLLDGLLGNVSKVDISLVTEALSRILSQSEMVLETKLKSALAQDF
jgi:hypothetical protein